MRRSICFGTPSKVAKYAKIKSKGRGKAGAKKTLPSRRRQSLPGY